MQPYRPGANNSTPAVVWSIVIMLGAFAFFAWCCGGPTPTKPAASWGAKDPDAALAVVFMVPVIGFAVWKCVNNRS